MTTALAKRAEKGSLRIYQEYSAINNNNGTVKSNDEVTSPAMTDFSSNDYLGLARDPEQQHLVETRYQSLLAPPPHNQQQQNQQQQPVLGATGSRLLSGDSSYARQLEQRLAQWHKRPAALLFNSGYDANLAVLSSLPNCDYFLFDEYAHNSLHMGMRLSRTFKDQTTNAHQKEVSGSFRHNSVSDLRQKLEQIKASSLSNYKNTGGGGSSIRTLIVVESVYSMDGDQAPLQAMLDLALEFGALVLVDEAHGIGIFGDDRGAKSRGVGVLAQFHLEAHPALACSIHTFGKAAGCHGAVVCGSLAFRQYLWNYGWPLIYSTSLPLHSLVAIDCSYEAMTSFRGRALRRHTQSLVDLFRSLVESRIIHLQQKQGQQQGHLKNRQLAQPLYLLPSNSPIQAIVLPTNGNQACTEFCERIWELSRHTIRLYPIKSPTVPQGMERIRIILHGHNTPAEVHKLVDCVEQCLVDMQLLAGESSSRTSRRRMHSRL